MRVRLPVLTIHGNHDDPSGADRLSAVDLLSAARLVNYFGKLASSGQGCQMSAGHAGAGKGGVASGVRARAHGQGGVGGHFAAHANRNARGLAIVDGPLYQP